VPVPGMHSGIATDDALNLSMSEHDGPLYEAVKAFSENEIQMRCQVTSAMRARRWCARTGWCVGRGVG
jgi:hypothetical protein